MAELESANIAQKAQTEQSRKQRRPPSYLKAWQRDQLLASVNHVRDRAILTVFLYAGLRRNELRLLDRSDVDFFERTLLVRFAKGSKWRKLRLNQHAEDALRAYLDDRLDADPALFLSARRLRISNRSLNVILDRHAGKVGLTHITVHGLRHTFGTALMRQSRDLRVVQRALGHARIETTSIYAHLEDDEMYGAMDAL